MSGGFHPFHAGHASLYQQAKEAFPDATVLVCATNVQTDRPFPFKLKKKLAQLSGVPPKDFIEVSKQFTIQDPALARRIGDPNNAIVIYVRSDKDKNEPPLPYKPNPDGSPVLGKRGKPLSDYLLEYPGNNAKLSPATEHAYMAYLKTVEFGPGITSASEIRAKWPTLNDRRKLAMVMSLYPVTQKDPKVAKKVVEIFDQVMGGEQSVAEGWKDVVAGGAMALGALGAGAQTMPDINTKQVELANKYYNVLVQRAKEDGIKLDTRTLNAIKAKATDAAAQKFQQNTPQQQNTFPSQGSERKVSKDIGQFESQGVAEGLGAEEYKQKLLSSLPQMMRFYEKNVKGWKPSEEQMLAAVETGYMVMKHTGDVKQAGKAVMDELNTLHRMSQGQQGVAEDKEFDPITKTVLSFYKPVVNDIYKEKLPDYVDQARELMNKTNDPSVREKLLDIFKKGKSNPYLQGGIITTVGALLAGGVLNSAQSMGLSPSQTNLALQGILNTVIPTLVSRINGKNWVDTIKYTLASAGVGTGIAAITEEDLEEGFGPGYPETYEQENKPFTHKGQYRITDITTESVDYLEEV